jgi:hypothetical protein
MNINDEKHEIRNEPYEELPTYEEVAGQSGCKHEWLISEDGSTEECVWCGEERDFFVSLETLVYLKNGNVDE